MSDQLTDPVVIPELVFKRSDGSFTSALVLAELAKFVGISDHAALQRAKRGKLPAPLVVLGRVRYWSKDQAEKLKEAEELAKKEATKRGRSAEEAAA